MGVSILNRCAWVPSSPLDIEYHDIEWGVPSFDDRHLFEMLTLEGAQAGLSWTTILKKREGYRAAFSEFDAVKVARYSPARVARLLKNPEIVRNRLKVTSTVDNAKAFLAVQNEFGSFSAFLWNFVDGKPVQNHIRRLADIPAQTETSHSMSKALLKHGFRFVGPTICYALMQAVGMVNDHEIGCFRHAELYRRGT